MGTPLPQDARSDDISGILILRHLMSEVIVACRACRLDHLTEHLERALRGVQPQPFQAMRKRKPKPWGRESLKGLLRTRRRELRSEAGARRRRPSKRSVDED